MPINRTASVVVGIDVGGRSKGLHAVALEGGRYRAQFATRSIEDMVRWSTQEIRASVIAIDAPCAWSVDERRGRPAELALMQQRIWCFSTPKEAAARRHTKNHYGWMLYGMELYAALRHTHPVRDPNAPGRDRYCFETFPHAITWHLQGGEANAKKKWKERRDLLHRLGIDRADLKNIDTVDAALCAYTAHLAATRAKLFTYGEPRTGLIIVPLKAQARKPA